MESKQDLETVLNAGEKTIGAIVCWSLSGYDADRATFGEAVTKAWPDASAAVARQPSPGAALTTAVGKLERSKSRGLLFRKLKANSFAMVRETQVVDELQHKHIATVTATEDGPQWAALVSENGASSGFSAISIQVEQHWRRQRDRVDSAELSAVLTELMHGTWKRPLLGAFSLRESSGGVYFVPAVSLPHLRAVKEAIESTSAGCRIGILTVSGTSENLATAAADARASFARQLAEIREEVEEFTANLRGSNSRADKRNLATRAERFRVLRDRVDMFSTVLGDVATELKDSIENTKNELLETLEAV